MFANLYLPGYLNRPSAWNRILICRQPLNPRLYFFRSDESDLFWFYLKNKHPDERFSHFPPGGVLDGTVYLNARFARGSGAHSGD